MKKNRIEKIAKIYKASFEHSGILQTNPTVTEFETRDQALEKKQLKAPKSEDKYPETSSRQPKSKASKPSPASTLSTRYTPSRKNSGTQSLRVDDDSVADPYTGKIYNYKEGFVMEDGTVVYGGSVSLQTKV